MNNAPQMSQEMFEAITEARRVRKLVARATYSLRKGGIQITTTELIGKNPDFYSMSVKEILEDVEAWKKYTTPKRISETLQQLSSYKSDKLPVFPTEYDVVIDNFVESFSDEYGKNNSTLAQWNMNEWWKDVSKKFTKEQLATAISKSVEQGYDYEDLTYQSDDTSTYETHTFINVTMQNLHDELDDVEESGFSESWNDYMDRWNRDVLTAMEHDYLE